MEKCSISLVPSKMKTKTTLKFCYTSRIFKADVNGHKYYSWVDVGDEGFKAVYNDEETKRHEKECLVLSYEMKYKWMEEKDLFEMQIDSKDGNVDLYHNNRYYDGEDPNDCRYREGLIGFLEEAWVNKEDWEGKAYSEDGKLLVDQYSVDGSIPEYISIAYIADKDALYINGKLYYRQK